MRPEFFILAEIVNGSGVATYATGFGLSNSPEDHQIAEEVAKGSNNGGAFHCWILNRNGQPVTD